MFGIEHSGAIRIKWRRVATLTLGWILIHFDDGMRFALSEVSGLVVNRSKRRHIILSLSDWPPTGIDVSGLVSASRQPDVFVGGGQDRREYAVTPQTDSWLIAKDFASGLLADSGYVGFEEPMSKLSREECLAYREEA